MKKQKVQAKINLEALAGGAFAEKLNEALMQVAENIQNPNTEATTKRQITVNIKFTPNKTRQMVGTQIAVTTKLAATEAIDTQMVMGINMRTGQIEIAEYDGRSADRWISPTSRTPIRIRNQRKHKLQLLHRDRIRPASLWILKTEENRHLLPLPN